VLCIDWRPATFPSCQDVVSENPGGQGGSRELRQGAVGLHGDFVDIRTDHHRLGVGEQHLDRLNGLPVGKSTGNRGAGGGHQCTVQPINVQREVNGSFERTKFVQPRRPCRSPVVRVLRGFGEKRGDAVITLHAFRFLLGVRANARLQQPARSNVKGSSSRTGVRERFTIKGGTKVGVRVELHQGELAEIATDPWVVPSSVHQRRQNPVFTAQKKGKHVTCHEAPGMVGHVVQLRQQRRHGTLPHGGGVEGEPRREVLAKFRIVQFDLPAGFDACCRTVGRAMPVGGGELIGQRDHDHVRCIGGWTDAQKGAFDEGRFHNPWSDASFFILPMGRCPSNRCKRCVGGTGVEHLIWVGDQYNTATATQKWPLGLVRGDGMGMTLGELTRAIQQHIDLDMDTEVAQGMAEHALGFFGFYNRIIDNALEPTDRNLFYMFQDYDLLTTESEETTLWDGREWRIHYWKFKPDLRERVEAYMQRNLQEDEVDPFADIYSSDGAGIWVREDEKVTNPNAFTSDW